MFNTKQNLGGVYETPAVEVLNAVSEGVFCSSSLNNINDWGYDPDELGF